MKGLDLQALTSVWAAGPAGAGEHGVSIGQLLFPLINFLIFLYLVKRFALPLLRQHLQDRRRSLLTAIEEADGARQSAEALVRDYRDRLAELEAEKRKIEESLREEGESEKARLVGDARAMAERIRRDSQLLAEQEVQGARRSVRQLMARSARATAARLIEQELRPSDQARLVEEFLSEVGAIK